jgi:hypothetical protein
MNGIALTIVSPCWWGSADWRPCSGPWQMGRYDDPDGDAARILLDDD